jgi:hypothetical protein
VSFVGATLTVLNAVTITVFLSMYARQRYMRWRAYLEKKEKKKAASRGPRDPRKRSLLAAARMSVTALMLSDYGHDERRERVEGLMVNPMVLRSSSAAEEDGPGATGGPGRSPPLDLNQMTMKSIEKSGGDNPRAVTVAAAAAAARPDGDGGTS